MPPSVIQRQRKPIAPVQQLTPVRGLITRGLNIAASAPALILADVGFRGCEGIISAVVHSEDSCWSPRWSPRFVMFLRSLMFVVGVTLLLWPEVHLVLTTLVRHFVMVDAWVRLRVRMTVSWLLLFVAYLFTSTARRKPISLTGSVSETLMSPCGFLGVASIISFLSTVFRHFVYSTVYQSPLPEDQKSYGHKTFAMMAIYGLAMFVDGQYMPVATPLIACHVLLERDVCEVFRRLLRPKLITLSLRNSPAQGRAVVFCLAVFASTPIFIAMIYGLLGGGSVPGAWKNTVWFTLPLWLLLPWIARAVVELCVLVRSDLLPSFTPLSDVEISDMAPIAGEVAYAVFGFPMFACIINTFHGHPPVAWLIWYLVGDICFQCVYDSILAYQRSAPRRALYKWISDRMVKPAPTDQRLTNDFCAICFAQPRSREDVRVTSCNHMYHIVCLAQWLFNQTTCPTCRRQLRQPGPLTAYTQNYNNHSWFSWF